MTIDPQTAGRGAAASQAGVAVAARGPTAIADRALGPDLARGTMLLLIALANSHYFLQGAPYFGGFPQDGGPLDQVVTWLISTFVDGRAYPMFALLFGYGVARIVARQTGTPKQVRHLLWRRSGVLFAVGFVHAMVLFVGDILAAYGVLLFVGAWAVRWKDRSLLIVAAIFFVVCALPSEDSLAIGTTAPDASVLSPDLWTQFAERITVQPWIAFLGPVGLACPFLVGIWAGRRRVIEQPELHRRLLAATAVFGIGAAVIGAQPVALAAAQLVSAPSDAALTYLGPLHDATGVLGGFGYAALIALVSLRIARPLSPLPRAIAATGQRSMTCYLSQSIVWFVVFTPYVLGLADDLSVTATALLAAGTWATTVVMADRMRAAGERGPFERLTRRVTYGRAAQPLPSSASSRERRRSRPARIIRP